MNTRTEWAIKLDNSQTSTTTATIVRCSDEASARTSANMAGFGAKVIRREISDWRDA